MNILTGQSLENKRVSKMVLLWFRFSFWNFTSGVVVPCCLGPKWMCKSWKYK